MTNDVDFTCVNQIYSICEWFRIVKFVLGAGSKFLYAQIFILVLYYNHSVPFIVYFIVYCSSRVVIKQLLLASLVVCITDISSRLYN